jgi:hypothetical protein
MRYIFPKSRGGELRSYITPAWKREFRAGRTPLAMKLHIYPVDGLVKDKFNNSIMYFIRRPRNPFPSRALEVFRGDPVTNAPRIATIKSQGFWSGDQKIIFLRDEMEIFLKYPRMFNSWSKFVVAGKEYGWNKNIELIELESMQVLARIDWASSPLGVLDICGDGVEIVDIVVLTAMVVSTRWEGTSRNHEKEAAPNRSPNLYI